MDNDSSLGPVFDQPPIIECVVGIQFERILNFSNAHLGWFWRSKLANWGTTADAPAIPDQFGERPVNVAVSLPTIRFGPDPLKTRLQIINEKDDRVVQIQGTRFIFNWRKRKDQYPGFAQVLAEFSDHFSNFREFLKESNLPEVSPNQWELSYVDDIPKGQLWHSPSDWCGIFPRLYPQAETPKGIELESINGELNFRLSNNRGRLHIGFSENPSDGLNQPSLRLQMLARGPIKPNLADWSFESGIEIGHQAIIDTFIGSSSEKAQKFWGIHQ